eukprot:scaffold3151_cov68-Isochrysis_galbana.AAC.1
MRQATEAATEAAALRREWTSAEVSPYCPQARPRTGPKAARAPETAVVLPPLWAWTAGEALGGVEGARLAAVFSKDVIGAGPHGVPAGGAAGGAAVDDAAGVDSLEVE